METKAQFHDATDELVAVIVAAEALVGRWARSAEPLSTRVSASQLRALVTIARAEPLNLAGLADALGATASSASRLCDRLVAAGFVTRSPSRESRREIALALTRDGRDLLVELDRARRDEIGEVLTRMSAGTRRQLVSGLQAFAVAAGPESETVPDLGGAAVAGGR